MKWILVTGTWRLTNEVASSDEVCAFQVNKSTGTADTIKKAEVAGLKIGIHRKYSIEE